VTTVPAAGHAPEAVPMWRARWVLYALGAAAVLYGGWGLLGAAERTQPLSAALWFGGGVLAHDAVLAPAVLLVAAAVVRWVPVTARAVVQGALLVSGAVTVVALPLVAGLGGAAGNPSANPLPYARNLALVLAAVWATAALLVGLRAWRAFRLRRRTTAP
jgi:hypothetical protein